ncbi:MAG: HAD family phosphatase, partial [Erysipelotrichaceae bacterium]|nr:HAD family phosphatase [Erysipelotrichaceae bacterium]
MKKLLFVDVDGTLVDYEGKIPQSAITAIRKARSNNHKVYICTGRSEAEVYKEIWDIGLDGMIGANGGYVKDGDQVIMHQLLTKDQCARVVEWCHQRNIEFYL